MVFEGLITGVLNKVLGDFIENLDANQLNISLLKGDVLLENVQIKPTLFDNYPFPFKLHLGQVGRIFIDIPMTGIFSKPLKINISDVFMIVKPKPDDLWKDSVELEAFKNGVQGQLDQLEVFFQSQDELESEDPGMATRLVNKIVDNVQIDISNVYVRFEDDLSNPNMPWAFGLTLDSMNIFTTDNNWEKKHVTGEDVSKKCI